MNSESQSFPFEAFSHFIFVDLNYQKYLQEAIEFTMLIYQLDIKKIIHRELHLLKPHATITNEISKQAGIYPDDLERAKTFQEVIKAVETSFDRKFSKNFKMSCIVFKTKEAQMNFKQEYDTKFNGKKHNLWNHWIQFYNIINLTFINQLLQDQKSFDMKSLKIQLGLKIPIQGEFQSAHDEIKLDIMVRAFFELRNKQLINTIYLYEYYEQNIWSPFTLIQQQPMNYQHLLKLSETTVQNAHQSLFSSHAQIIQNISIPNALQQMPQTPQQPEKTDQIANGKEKSPPRQQNELQKHSLDQKFASRFMQIHQQRNNELPKSRSLDPSLRIRDKFLPKQLTIYESQNEANDEQNFTKKIEDWQEDFDFEERKNSKLISQHDFDYLILIDCNQPLDNSPNGQRVYLELLMFTVQVYDIQKSQLMGQPFVGLISSQELFQNKIQFLLRNLRIRTEDYFNDSYQLNQVLDQLDDYLHESKVLQGKFKMACHQKFMMELQFLENCQRKGSSLRPYFKEFFIINDEWAKFEKQMSYRSILSFLGIYDEDSQFDQRKNLQKLSKILDYMLKNGHVFKRESIQKISIGGSNPNFRVGMNNFRQIPRHQQQEPPMQSYQNSSKNQNYTYHQDQKYYRKPRNFY